MPIPFLDSFLASRHRKAVARRATAAKAWPLTIAEVNHWKIQQAEEKPGSFSSGYQLEAAFHFKLNGEYYGGYFRSVPMTHHEAEIHGQGAPAVNIRYDPANPDDNLVLPEDNANLPFQTTIF